MRCRRGQTSGRRLTCRWSGDDAGDHGEVGGGGGRGGADRARELRRVDGIARDPEPRGRDALRYADRRVTRVGGSRLARGAEGAAPPRCVARSHHLLGCGRRRRRGVARCLDGGDDPRRPRDPADRPQGDGGRAAHGGGQAIRRAIAGLLQVEWPDGARRALRIQLPVARPGRGSDALRAMREADGADYEE